MGGNLSQARHYSRLVALQLAARYDGLPTPVYSPHAQRHQAAMTTTAKQIQL
jgi:putative flavoprotein involved in K+ transport